MRCLLVSTLVVNVSALKASMITLKLNKTYYKYDITGDKIKLTQVKSNDMYKNITISINGKKSVIKPSYSYYSSTIKLIHLSNGKAFLWVKGFSDNDDLFEAIYQYKKGKMVKVLDFRGVNQKYGIIQEQQ